MKNINKLLQQIERYAALAEAELSKFAVDHADKQGLKRINDPRLLDSAIRDIERKMTIVQNMKDVFDKMPSQSKWTLNTVGGLKAIVQKIWEMGRMKLIFKTFLKEEMGLDYEDADGVKISGSLEDLVQRTSTGELRRTIKAVEKLLERKLPMSAEQMKAQSSPEYWKKIQGILPFLRGGMITPEAVTAYQASLERELAKLIGALS